MLINKDENYYTTSIRIKRFLYCLGFMYSITQGFNNKELYVFTKTKELDEALELFFKIRKLNQDADVSNTFMKY